MTTSEYGSRGGQSIGGKKAVELFEKLMGCSIDQEGVKAAVLADGKVTFSEFCALVKVSQYIHEPKKKLNSLTRLHCLLKRTLCLFKPS